MCARAEPVAEFLLELLSEEIPAGISYDQCMKASHLFNLLDARGVISVTERAAYMH